MDRTLYISLLERKAYIEILYAFHKENKKDREYLPHEFIHFINTLKLSSKNKTVKINVGGVDIDRTERTPFNLDEFIDWVCEQYNKKFNITFITNGNQLVKIY